MASDAGFIEDLLNEEDQDIFAEEQNLEEEPAPAAVSNEAPAPHEQRIKEEPELEQRIKKEPEAAPSQQQSQPHRPNKLEFKPQKQSQQQKQQGSFPLRQQNNMNQRGKYFIVRSANMENVSLSFEHGAWATQIRNEPMFVDAFNSADNVYLIFSVNQSGHFQGYGRMTTLPGKWTGRKMPWHGAHNVGSTFGVEWACWSELPYDKTLDLHNPWNEGKPVKISRDGVELPPDVGEKLLKKIQEFATEPAPAYARKQGRQGGVRGAGAGTARPGFVARGGRPNSNFDRFSENRPVVPGMMDGFEVGRDGPMGPMGPGMGPIGPGMAPMAVGMAMRPIMGPGGMAGDGSMNMLGGPGMGMGPMGMDAALRPMMDPMSMQRMGMGMGMGLGGPPNVAPARNRSVAPFHGPSDGPMVGQSGGMRAIENGRASAFTSQAGNRPSGYGGVLHEPSSSGQQGRDGRGSGPGRGGPGLNQQRGRSPDRRRSDSTGRARVHSRSRSRSHSRGRAPNIMDMSYDEYLEHYKKVQRRMREMQDVKSSQGSMGAGGNSMGAAGAAGNMSGMFGGIMGMGGMAPGAMMGGMGPGMMGGGMMGANMGMMNNMYNMGGMMNRANILSESDYIKYCEQYYAMRGRPLPAIEKIREHYRVNLKAKYDSMLKQQQVARGDYGMN